MNLEKEIQEEFQLTEKPRPTINIEALSAILVECLAAPNPEELAIKPALAQAKFMP